MCLGLDTERACLSLCGASTSFPLVKLVKISLAELDHFQHGSRWCYIVVTCVLKLREEFHMHCFVYLDSFPSLIKSYLADKIIEVSWLSWLIRHISIRNGPESPSGLPSSICIYCFHELFDVDKNQTVPRFKLLLKIHKKNWLP